MQLHRHSGGIAHTRLDSLLNLLLVSYVVIAVFAAGAVLLCSRVVMSLPVDEGMTGVYRPPHCFTMQIPSRGLPHRSHLPTVQLSVIMASALSLHIISIMLLLTLPLPSLT